MDNRSISPTGIEAEVCADIAARQAVGVQKYGCTVADNPLLLREWLQHALTEGYDQVVYLKRAIRALDDEEAARADFVCVPRQSESAVIGLDVTVRVRWEFIKLAFGWGRRATFRLHRPFISASNNPLDRP